MPDGMPFMKQKGPAVLNFESKIPKSKGALFDLLVALHQPDKQVGDILAPILNDPPQQPGQLSLVDHLRVHWFGYRQFQGDWEPQPPYGKTYGSGSDPVFQTGHWVNYHGDVEAIARVALIRAVERMLELGPIDYPRNPALAPPVLTTDGEFQSAYQIKGTGHLKGDHGYHLEVWWVCPQPRFEAAVETYGSCVRLEFLTPAPEGGVLGSGYRGTDPKPFEAASQPQKPSDIGDVLKIVGKDGPASKGGGLQPNRLVTAGPSEAWLIGQDEIRPEDAFQWVKMASLPFIFLDPFSRFVGSGDVATIDVKEIYGGRP